MKAIKLTRITSSSCNRGMWLSPTGSLVVTNCATDSPNWQAVWVSGRQGEKLGEIDPTQGIRRIQTAVAVSASSLREKLAKRIGYVLVLARERRRKQRQNPRKPRVASIARGDIHAA